MADKKITQLTNITGANLVDADEFVVVDISADETKAITLGELKEAFDSGSGFVRITGDTMTGDLALSGADVTFGDNDKAIFGAGSDLQIYHDGSHARLRETTGDFRIQTTSGGVNALVAKQNAEVEITYAGSTKLATTSTGIDVTGTAVTDGLTVAGNLSVDGGTIKLDGSYPVGTDNTALGDAALGSVTTGNYNTAIGDNALNANTSGGSNDAHGAYALALNTTGNYNVALGSSALYNNTTGTDNVSLGYYSLVFNTTGNHNTAVGRSALLSNTSGSNNTALGYQAAYSNLTGYQNTAVGYRSVENNTTGVYNTGIGSQALFSNTTGGNNVAIGRSALENNTTASNNTAVGYQAAYSNTTSTTMTAIGYQAAKTSSTADWVTAVGYQALLNNTNSVNTALGRAMVENTTGSNNTALGMNALYYNTTGSTNTAVGEEALFINTVSSNNTAFGYRAGYSHVSSIGGNTYIGKEAGKVSTGALNTYLGDNSGSAITTGDSNTILGRFNGNSGGVDIRTSSNNIVLSDGDGNPRGYYHGGLTSPLWEFNNGGINGQWLARFSNTTNGGSPYGLTIKFTQVAPDNNNTQFLVCADNSTTRMLVTNQGDLQNHDNSYGAISDVKLKEQIEDASSQWQDIKDLTIRKYKMKTDIADKGDSNELWRLGVVAQEVETAGMSGLVYETPDRDEDNNDLGTTTKAVKYSILYMKAVKALQEAMDRIETLEAKVTALENA